jgi:hypothetical protein
MHEEVADWPAQEQTPSRRWRLPFTWLGLLALAWIVYELTHQPALGAVAVCLKFGWEDFCTARWLSRTDPDRRRGRACSWLFFAWGLWKTACVAFLMSVAFAAVAPAAFQQAGAVAALWAFVSTFLTTLAGFAASALATTCAVITAWRGGLRLWLDRAVHRARRLDCWPPAPLCEGRTNRIGQLLVTALALAVSWSGVVAFICVFQAGLPRFGPPTLVALGLVGPWVVCRVRDFIARRVRAETPWECWPEA